MGTRHITAVVSEGQFVVAQYGQWDGYPTGAGNDIVAIISGKIDQLKASLKLIVPVDSDTVERYWSECGSDGRGADMETRRRFKVKHRHGNVPTFQGQAPTWKRVNVSRSST